MLVKTGTGMGKKARAGQSGSGSGLSSLYRHNQPDKERKEDNDGGID